MSSIALTSMPLPGLLSAYRAVRRHAEAAVAGLAFGIVGLNSTAIAFHFAADWRLDGFYSALFNWSSVQTGFVFSVYAFFVARSEGFVRAIERTPAFSALRQYVVRTLLASVALALLTLPSLVVAPSLGNGGRSEPGFMLFWLVTTLAVYTFMCFAKVVRVFVKTENLSR